MPTSLTASPELTDEVLTDALINGVEESWDCGFLKDVLAGTSLGAVLPQMISELRRHRSSPSSAWRDIKDAPKEPVGIDPQIDWNIGEHGPYILIAFDREHYPEWGASVGWWAPKWNCWRWLEDDGPNDVQPTYFQPLPEPPK